MRWLMFLLLGGCQFVFDLVPPIDGPPDAPPDGPPCVMPSASFSGFDNVTSANPCAELGTPNNDSNTIVEVVNSELHLTPMPDIVMSNSGCFSTVPQAFEAGGLFVEMIQPAMGDKEYCQFVVSWEGTAAFSNFSRGGTDVAFFNETGELARRPIDAASRWWRVRPRPDGLAVIAEISPDGRSWETIATDPRPPPATVKFNLVTGVFSPGHEPVATTTIIGGVNLCP